MSKFISCSKRWNVFVGGRFKHLRKEAGLSRLELSRRTGIPFYTLREFECGKNNNAFVLYLLSSYFDEKIT